VHKARDDELKYPRSFRSFLILTSLKLQNWSKSNLNQIKGPRVSGQPVSATAPMYLGARRRGSRPLLLTLVLSLAIAPNATAIISSMIPTTPLELSHLPAQARASPRQHMELGAKIDRPGAIPSRVQLGLTSNSTCAFLPAVHLRLRSSLDPPSTLNLEPWTRRIEDRPFTDSKPNP
jgi:hypothetical protein